MIRTQAIGELDFFCGFSNQGVSSSWIQQSENESDKLSGFSSID